MTSNIEIIKLKAETPQEAFDEFMKEMKYKRFPNTRAIKDWYVCDIVAVEGAWNEPKGITILSTEIRKHESDTGSARTNCEI